MTHMATMHSRFQGFYNCVVIRGDGTREETGWFPNLITNQGLDYIGAGLVAPPNQSFAYDAAGVGTGNTTPAFTDTTLASQLATSITGASGPVGTFSNTPSYVAGSPPYWTGINQINFPLGGVIGNIAEVGIGTIVAGTLKVFSRALILDGGGLPTTISLGATDTFQLFYEERLYISTVDVSYSFIMNGVTYSGVIRPASITSALPRFNYFVLYQNGTYNCTWSVYNGSIGATSGTPSGTRALVFFSSAGVYTPGTYTNGTYTLSFSLFASTSQLNVSGGISAMQFIFNTMNYQCSVTPTIPKDSTYTLQLNMAVSWNRF